MRFDNTGMFWDDPVQERGQKRHRPMPAIPESTWRPPREFPNLSAAKAIAVDVETYDPNLTTRGPGWGRGDGHIVGLAIGATDGHHVGKWYFPMRHEVQGELNLDAANVLAWARDALSNPNQVKVGANLQYDLGWLQQEGVDVAGKLIDVQFAEALLTEKSPVALEALAQKYLNEGKDSPELYKWCDLAYGGGVTPKQRANIYRAPVTLVGPYAESDVDLPLRLAPILHEKIWQDGLMDVYTMENGLIRLMVAMRMQGVSVDIPTAEKTRDQLLAAEQTTQKRLDRLAGFPCNVNVNDDLARAFDANGLGYNRTAAGNPSFTKEFLNNVEHPLGELIRDVRSFSKLRGTFVEGYILDANVKGKVYGSFHQLRSDDGGTRSGRFSSSDPNLQNIPSRDPTWAPVIRGMFVPDVGHKLWRSYDYSQIEYRCLAHYAVGDGADALRAEYNANPLTDYHDKTHSLVLQLTGKDIPRKPIKNINFGGIYGVGKKKLIRMLGIGDTLGRELYSAYHQAAPYASATLEHCADIVNMTGEITTILGRKSRFDLWEPAEWDDKRPALPYHAALSTYGDIRRAATHKALNRRLQGSAADIMKMAMLRCWEDGIFDATGVPRLTVHDELDFSDPGGCDEAFNEMQRVMETALPLNVPVVADYESGPDWGRVT